MSWLLKRNKQGKYAIWTTISDGWVTNPKWLTKEEAIEFIANVKRERLEQEIKELEDTFPYGWFDKDTHKMFTKE